MKRIKLFSSLKVCWLINKGLMPVSWGYENNKVYYIYELTEEVDKELALIRENRELKQLWSLVKNVRNANRLLTLEALEILDGRIEKDDNLASVLLRR